MHGALWVEPITRLAAMEPANQNAPTNYLIITFHPHRPIRTLHFHVAASFWPRPWRQWEDGGDQQNGSQVFAENDTRATGRWRGEAGLLATPPDGRFPKQNIGPVKFEIPKVPVIFVLGGPGSGKVTYCDNLIQERKGITHINMMDLLQQYALGNG
ncbi:hypothetical protein P5V15_002650 [Pogonomyrmex californicus]